MKPVAVRSDVLLAILVVGCAISGLCLYYFGWGMFFMQDLWDVSLYVRYLVGGLAAAIAAFVASELLRRRFKETASGASGSTLLFVARAMLVVQVLVFLYCNVGLTRTVWVSIIRRAATYGMARDLPPPPPAAPPVD